jgi:hypothetical protein
MLVPYMGRVRTPTDSGIGRATPSRQRHRSGDPAPTAAKSGAALPAAGADG